jgi:hypothetical protein
VTDQDNRNTGVAPTTTAGQAHPDPLPGETSAHIDVTATGVLDEETEAALRQLVDNAVPKYTRKGARGRWTAEQTAEQDANTALREDLLKRLRDGAIAANALAAMQRENSRLHDLNVSYQVTYESHRRRADRLQKTVGQLRDQDVLGRLLSQLGRALDADAEGTAYDGDSHRFRIRRLSGVFTPRTSLAEPDYRGDLTLTNPSDETVRFSVWATGLRPHPLQAIADAFGARAEAEDDAADPADESKRFGVLLCVPNGLNRSRPYAADHPAPWQQGGAGYPGPQG